jgi:molybdate transport system substrate-binding protein
MRRSIVSLALVLCATLVAVGGCDDASVAPSADAPSANPNAGVVRVAAAFSLTDALTAAKAPFEAANPGTRLVITFGPSQAFVGQVQTGGFDAFASEDLAGAQAVVTAQRAAGPAQVFATDRIVLITAAQSTAGVKAPADLARPGVRVATTAADSPLAIATGGILTALETDAGVPKGYADAVRANSTSAGNDPRATVAAVQQGKADAAFVYASDIHAAEGLVQVPLTATLAPKAVTRFAVVVIAAAGDPVAAAAFARWLTNEAGQAALAPFGFDPPGSL